MLSLLRRGLGRVGGVARPFAPRLPLRALSTSPAEAASEAAPILAYTSDMRPAGDTSRKWVKIDPLGRAYATGRRKTAVARVWIWPTAEDHLASVRINKQSISRFFGGHWNHRHTVLAPFFETETAGRFSVMATVKGGGPMGARSRRLDCHRASVCSRRAYADLVTRCSQVKLRTCATGSRLRCRASMHLCARRLRRLGS